MKSGFQTSKRQSVYVNVSKCGSKHAKLLFFFCKYTISIEELATKYLSVKTFSGIVVPSAFKTDNMLSKTQPRVVCSNQNIKTSTSTTKTVHINKRNRCYVHNIMYMHTYQQQQISILSNKKLITDEISKHF